MVLYSGMGMCCVKRIFHPSSLRLCTPPQQPISHRGVCVCTETLRNHHDRTVTLISNTHMISVDHLTQSKHNCEEKGLWDAAKNPLSNDSAIADAMLKGFIAQCHTLPTHFKLSNL